MTNTRTFFLRVNPKFLPFTMDPVKRAGFTNVKTSQGYYLSYRNGLVPSQQDVEKAVAAFHRQIMIVIQREEKYLIRYWQKHSKAYFNRSKRGFFSFGSKLSKALVVQDANAFGARFYVRPCYNGGSDYINFLVKGAGPTYGNHYVPKYNARIPGGVWRGITSMYWTVWQSHFKEQVRQSQIRLDKEVMKMVEAFKRTQNAKVIYAANTTKDTNKAKAQEEQVYTHNKLDDKVKGSKNYSNFFSEVKDEKAVKSTKTPLVRKFY